MLTRSRALVLLVVGLLVAGCGAVHPGAAAVVDGQTISMKTLDRTARVYCALTLPQAKSQGVTSISNTDMRRQAVTALVSLVVARKLAESRGLRVSPAAYELTATQEAQIDKSFPKRAADVKSAIEDSQEVSAIAVALGEKSTGEQRTATNEAALAEAGQKEIAAAFPQNDVSFSPRLGLGDSGKAVATTGTLSATPTDLEATPDEELPDLQRCS